MTPDPKPPKRVKDPEVLANLHRMFHECFLCEEINRPVYSAHHVHKHPRDDVPANLVLLCGTGTTGCHGDIEHAVGDARARLVRKIRLVRPDVIGYLTAKLKTTAAADEWLRQYAEGKDEARVR